MIPYLLAAIGGYMIGQSQKDTFGEGGKTTGELPSTKDSVEKYMDSDAEDAKELKDEFISEQGPRGGRSKSYYKAYRSVVRNISKQNPHLDKSALHDALSDYLEFLI